MSNEEKYQLYMTVPSVGIGVLFISVLIFGLIILEPIIIIIGVLSLFLLRDKLFFDLMKENNLFRNLTILMIVFNAFILLLAKYYKAEVMFFIIPVFIVWLIEFAVLTQKRIQR